MDGTRWEGALEKKIFWTVIWQTEHQRVRFAVQAMYDVLNCSANFRMHLERAAITGDTTVC